MAHAQNPSISPQLARLDKNVQGIDIIQVEGDSKNPTSLDGIVFRINQFQSMWYSAAVAGGSPGVIPGAVAGSLFIDTTTGDIWTASALSSYPYTVSWTAITGGGGGGSALLQTNSIDNVSQAVLNLETSTVNAVGLIVTPINTSGGIVKFEITGSALTLQTNSLNNSSQSALNFETSSVNATGLTVTPVNTSGAIMKFEITGSSLSLQTNSSPNSSQSVLNFETSSVNAAGLIVTPVNTFGGIEKFEITGSLLILSGSTGSATLGVASAAGTPHRMNLPTSSGLAGQVLSTDGSNPQQLSWTTAAIALPYGVDVGVANAYIVNTTPSISPVLGTAISWTTTHPNTSTCTINVNGIGAVNLLNPDGYHVLTTGNILANVQYSATYDGQEWILGGFGTISASVISLQGTITLISTDPGMGFNPINGAPITLLAKNPPASRQPLLAFGNAAGTSNVAFGFDSDNVFVVGGNMPTMAFLSGMFVEFFDHVAIYNNSSFGGDDLLIQPSLGGLNKTSGTMLNVQSGDQAAGIAFDFRNHLTQIGHPIAGVATFVAGTTIDVVYATAFSSTPVVVFSPVAPGAIAVTLTASSNAGFTLTASVPTSISVNYVVIGNPN